MALFWVRAGFLLLVLTYFVVAARYPDWAKRHVRRFFFTPVPAFNLGLLRIIIFGHLLYQLLTTDPAWYVGLPRQLLSLPRGWDWLDHWIPPDPATVGLLHELSIVACGCAVIGLFSRVTCALTAAASLLLLGIPNFYLKIGHTNHLSVLCAMLLAFAPAGSGLSFDQVVRRLRGAPPNEPSARYGVPIRLAMLLLATTYFFPGFWKLWDTGDYWISGEKLRTETMLKWADLPDYVPALRLIDLPVICAILGTWTLVFELGFLPALLHPVTRYFAVLNAIVFHFGISLTMGISFPLYLPLIAALTLGEHTEDSTPHSGWVRRSLAWASQHTETLIARLRRNLPDRYGRAYPPAPLAASASVWLVGTAVVSSMFVAGAAPFDTWPVGVYPRFATRALEVPTHGHALEFELARLNGEVYRSYQLGRFDVTRSVILARTILEVKNDPQAMRQRLGPLVAAVYHGWSSPQPGDILSIYQKNWVTDPRHRGASERALLVRLQL